MADVRLDLNDVVLIRAYGLLWRECEAKANRLMELIPRLIEKSGVGHGKITSQPKLSDRWEPRSVAYRYIVPGHDNDPEPSFSAGIGYDPRVGDYMGIFFEMGPKFPERQAVVAATTPLLPLLKKRNPQWNMPKSDGQDWCFLENRMPMTNLLGATSQETVLIDAIVRSLDEVKAVGVTEAIIAAVNGKTKTKASE